MKKYLTVSDLKKIEHKRGEILKDDGRISLVKRNSDEIETGTFVYTVWNYQEYYIFTNTQDLSEATATFEKYASSSQGK